MVYLQLFYEFFKAGLFAIGGGLATLPFLYKISEKFPEWFTQAQLIDMIAVSESTPGPIGINMATYAGYHAGGILGGVIATLGLVAPSIIVIILIAKILDKFKASKYVSWTFYGLRPAVVGLISAAAFEVIKVSLFTLDKFGATKSFADILNYKAILLFGAIIFLLYKLKKHPVVYIALAAAAGIAFKF
ncbi:MAG TPA: chromate transporter [Ruminococcaceae bacterium]|nr:chromate transporter [Oscillospiraceae bacterium]